jgi:serine/threonine-protein kinase
MPGIDQFEEYEVTSTIVEGRNSIIYRAQHNGTGRDVAIKTLTPSSRKKWVYRRQLYREARIAMQLDHPDIVRVFEYAKSLSNPFYVMEYFSGKSLKQKIKLKEEIPEDVLKALIIEVGEAIAYIHGAGFLHKDIKPENVLMDEKAVIKLIDFGLAEKINGRRWGLFGTSRKIQGTRLYMSPEQIMGQRLDARTDIYSFGVTLYELLIKKTPFVPLDKDMVLYQHLKERPSSLHSRNPRITKELDAIVLRMLEKDRRKRQHTMGEVVAELKKVDFFQDI